MDTGQEPPVDPLETMEQLREEIVVLRAAVRARDDFISVAAHELRNPMTPLVAQISLLRKNAHLAGNAVPARLVQGLERLDRIVRRYIARATTLLDISRLTSATFIPDLTMVDVSTVVADLAADFAFHAETAGSAITTSIESGIVVLLDRTAVEEIVENLISNAIKYGAGKPVEMSLSRDAGGIRIQVVDHGIGISAENQARIFERFERLMSGSHTGGFGLGLWVVGKLTEALGGNITVESRPGDGSTFTVRLPLQLMEGRT